MKKIPVHISDFREMIINDYFYLDKTLFIKEVLDKGDKVLLLPRPRRFGKTLNLSMLKYFYDCCPAKDVAIDTTGSAVHHAEKLFDSLAIMKAAKNTWTKWGNTRLSSFPLRESKNWIGNHA